MRYARIGLEVGELVDRKNEAYGSSFAKAGDFLALLWPEGITPDRYDDALLLVRIFDKQMRIATDRDAFGESPYRDIAGYGLLGAALSEERDAERDGECGTASAVAEDEPREQHASQPQSAPPPTTTSADATKPKSTSGGCFPPRVRYSLNAALQAAFAQDATASAPSEEVDRPLSTAWKFERAKDSWIARNAHGKCALCQEPFTDADVVRYGVLDTPRSSPTILIHPKCSDDFYRLVEGWRDAVATGKVLR